jgi:putative ABC transport system permease protein
MIEWFKIAWRNVLRNHRRSIVAISTVAIITSSLLLSYGYINFTFFGLSNNIVNGGLGNMQIADNRLWESFESTPLEFGMSNKKADELIVDLEKNKDVKRAMKRLLFSGIASNGEISTIFSGTGLENKKERLLQSRSLVESIISGTILRNTDKNPYQVLLAKDLASKLQANIGDNITLLSTTIYGSINAIDVIVKGIYDSGIPDTNLIELKTPLALAQELMLTEKVSRIVVQLENLDATEKVLPEIKNIISDDVGVRTWYQLAPYFRSVENIYYSIFTVMTTILLILSLLSINNVMTTSVNERMQEIGTLRAFGITKKDIKLNFIFEGLIIGFSGTLIGSLLGFIIAFTVSQSGYMMPPPPGRSQGYPLIFMLTINSTLIIAFGSSILAMLASYLPISKALRKKVVDQLNYV